VASVMRQAARGKAASGKRQAGSGKNENDAESGKRQDRNGGQSEGVCFYPFPLPLTACQYVLLEECDNLSRKITNYCKFRRSRQAERGKIDKPGKRAVFEVFGVTLTAFPLPMFVSPLPLAL